MDLTRGGGPSDRPPLDPEQQRQQEMQQQLEREQRIAEQTPQVMAQLGKELDQHPTLGPQLKQYSREQQEDIKKALTEGITQRIGRNGLQRIDGIAPTKDGGIMINFNEFRVVYLKGDQLPTLADGSRPVKIVEPARSATPEHQSAQQRESDRAPSSQRDRANTEPQRPVQERTLPAPGEYTSLGSLAQRQQQALQGTPLDDRHVAKPYFENGILVVKPIPYTNPFSPQPTSYESQQRQADIQTLLEPKLGNALGGYNPAQQNQLKQALTEEISDITGSSLKIDHIEKLDDGRLSIQLNQGLHQVYLNPQQVLQPEQETSPAREPLSPDEQTRQENQQQIQQQVEQLSQLQPFERLAIENRLREAVGDERIESLRLEGEDTFQLNLRNGMVLTASTHELLNMEDGRELLQRAQTDPTAQDNQTAETGQNDPSNQPGLSIQRPGLDGPVSGQVIHNDNLEAIGKRLFPDDRKLAQAASELAWYSLLDGNKNVPASQRVRHIGGNTNLHILHQGREFTVDMSQLSPENIEALAKNFAKREHNEHVRNVQIQQAEATRAAQQREQQNRPYDPLGLTQPQPATDPLGILRRPPSGRLDYLGASLDGMIHSGGQQPYTIRPSLESVLHTAVTKESPYPDNIVGRSVEKMVNSNVISAELTASAVSGVVAQAVGGAGSIPYALFDRQGAVAVQDWYKDKLTYQPQADVTKAFIQNDLAPVAQKVDAFVQEVRQSNVDYYGDGLTTVMFTGVEMLSIVVPADQILLQGGKNLVRRTVNAGREAMMVERVAIESGQAVKGAKPIAGEAARSAQSEVKAVAQNAEQIRLTPHKTREAAETVAQMKSAESPFELKRSMGRDEPKSPHVEHPQERGTPPRERTPGDRQRMDREQSEQTIRQLEQRLEQTVDEQQRKNLETFLAREREIAYAKEMPAPESFARNGLDDALHEAGLSRAQFDELRLTPVDMLNDEQRAMLKMVRDRVPKIDDNTLIQKAIPMDKVEAMMKATMDHNPRDLNVGGFVSRHDDVKHLKGFDEVYESLRLDYPASPYRPDEPYGIIRYKATNADKIEVAYGEKLGGNVKDGPPCTQNGFLSGRNGEVIAEYKAPYAVPKDGAQLIVVQDGKEILVAEFKAGKFEPVLLKGQ